MKTLVLILLVLCAAPAAGAVHQHRIVIGGLDGLDPEDGRERFSVLLALSGGGARGLATIGVLKAFEERGLDIAAVAGVSMGGIVGGLFAAGYSPAELDSMVNEISFDELLTNAPGRTTMLLTQRQERGRHLLSVRFDGLVPIIPQGLTAGQKLTNLLTDLTAPATYHSGGDFDLLPVPFRAISTDILTGDEIIHDRGSLSEAMRATMAFPLAFTGLDRDSQLLMDGGMVTPVPVNVVRQMCDSVPYVVAVNTVSPLQPRDQLNDPVAIANQVTSIMTADKLAAQLAAADFVIEPDLNGYSAVDFGKTRALIGVGYEAGLAAADSVLRQLREYRERMRYAILTVAGGNQVRGLADEAGKLLQGRWLNHSQLVDILRQLANHQALFRLEAIINPVGTTESGVLLVDLVLQAQPRPAMNEVRLEFENNTIFDDSALAAQFNDTAILLSSWNLKRSLNRIVALYHDAGYDLAGLRDVEVDHERQRVVITIDEAIIRRIDIRNNVRTKDWFVRTRFPLKRGDRYATARAGQGISDIYATDLFDRVVVNPMSDRDGVVVRITVEERKHRQARIGWHWDDEYKSEEFLEVLDDNVGGIGVQALARGLFGRDRHEYEFNVKADRIFKTFLTSTVKLYHRQLDRHLFTPDGDRAGDREETKVGGELRIGQQLARLGTVSGSIILEQVEYMHPDGLGEETFELSKVRLESLVETFDRVPFPQSGQRHHFELQLAGEFLGGDVEYTRFFASTEIYLPFGDRLNYHPRLSLGLSRSGLPASERFFLGGLRSFSGFRTHQLDGDKMVSLSNEVRVKLPLRLYFSVRHDMGEVYTATDEIKLRNLRHGVGAKLTLDLPVGPLEFGYGVADSDEERFYFSFGYSF